MQVLRRTIQLFVIFLILGVPILHLYGVDRYARESFTYSLAAEDIKKTAPLQRKALQLTDSVLGGLEDPEKIISSVTGSPWSLNVFGYNISEPLAAVSLSISGKNFYWPFLLSILFLTVLSILLGRVYCGWLCPFHFMAEMNNKLRRFFIILGIEPKNLVLKSRTKYIILLSLLVLAFVTGLQLFTHIYPPLVVSREAFNYLFFSTIGFGTFFILFLLLTELTLSERWWCRYVCPGGALYSVLGSLRVVRIIRIEKRCTECEDCNKACPFGLLPMSDRMGMECDNCGLCRSACKEKALVYGIMPLWKEKRMLKERMEEKATLHDERKTGTDG
jgi:ferredoxin-type protein NapH